MAFRKGGRMTMVMGGETEYAISARNREGRGIQQGPLLARFFDHAKATLGYASASTRGRFLRNGGLLYLDAGLHMEWATPEVTSPFEAVRYLEAGDRIVHGLASSFEASSPDIAEVFCSRANVDYLSGSLWAAHESYMHRVDGGELAAQLIPFLASRVIFGAGGWDYRAPALRFTLSPRAHFITHLVDRDSQHVRPLFHAKDEPLGGPGSHRLHVACSESLCSQTANVLRFGTTALVLALLERGCRPGNGVALASPIAAVQRFAADPELTARAQLTSGADTTAIGIQRHYLACVEASLGKIPFPWAEEVCALWEATLNDLERGATRIETTLDWAIKRRLFQRQLSRRGIEWTSLPWWHTVLTSVRRHWARKAVAGAVFDPIVAMDPDESLKAEIERLTPTLERRGLSWRQLPGLVAARQELFELDAKFGALGERGIFNALDAAGALQHRVRDFDVASAVLHPPQDTRARIRGDVVRRLSEAGIPYGAEWTRVYDSGHHRELDLMNPFESEERWRDVPHAHDPLSSTRA